MTTLFSPAFRYHIEIPMCNVHIPNVYSFTPPTLPPDPRYLISIKPYMSVQFSLELSEYLKHFNCFNIDKQQLNQLHFDMSVTVIVNHSEEIVDKHQYYNCSIRSIEPFFTTDIDFVEVELGVNLISSSSTIGQYTKQEQLNQAYEYAMKVLEKPYGT